MITVPEAATWRFSNGSNTRSSPETLSQAEYAGSIPVIGSTIHPFLPAGRASSSSSSARGTAAGSCIACATRMLDQFRQRDHTVYRLRSVTEE
ncbi:hypothetical protein I1A62_36965 [Rhodococcus sp. USK10]|uniref:hypothetical protein n=1 Tax=Rhodococcus sp. USK10 TaxID=2789739 RepID=UPI001C5E9E62|nr:hypothetical protein [Rhodococcus sp. USK10]QYB02729.1 hypothetical protein I1A62_36965 [Rhodococcus sp. USK10]